MGAATRNAMRSLKPVAWIGGTLTVLGLGPEPCAKLYWCSRRWIVTRYVQRRLTYWRVPEIATTLRIGRWEFQHLPGALWREPKVEG